MEGQTPSAFPIPDGTEPVPLQLISFLKSESWAALRLYDTAVSSCLPSALQTVALYILHFHAGSA